MTAHGGGAAIAPVQSGDRLAMPDGSVFTITRSAADAGGELVELDIELGPDWEPPPPHAHPRSSDEFEVLTGRVDVLVGDDWRSLDQGERLTVPPGTAHSLRNPTGAVVRLRNVHRPPVRFQEYVAHVAALARARGLTGARDLRTLVLLSMVVREYPDTFVWARPRERIAGRVLAAAGRALRWSTAP